MLPYNESKCHALSLRNKFGGAAYTMDNGDTAVLQLENNNCEKDIGVQIDSNLDFDSHILAAVKKANSRMGVIRRTFTTLDKDIFPVLFKAIVRPHLEYASPVWNPYQKRQIKIIEDVQRRSTKLLPKMSELSYEERLRELDLPTLVYRRARGDMIETYKLLTGKYDISLPTFLILSTHQHYTRGHHLKLQHRHSKLELRKHFYSNRVTTMWNDLPKTVINAKTIKEFEKQLDLFWKDQPFKFDFLASYQPL